MFHSFHFLTIHSLNSLLVSQVMVLKKTYCNSSRDWDGAYKTYTCYLHTIGAEHRILTVQHLRLEIWCFSDVPYQLQGEVFLNFNSTDCPKSQTLLHVDFFTINILTIHSHWTPSCRHLLETTNSSLSRTVLLVRKIH